VAEDSAFVISEMQVAATCLPSMLTFIS